jgi:predicted O-methyltransferase YrrM
MHLDAAEIYRLRFFLMSLAANARGVGRRIYEGIARPFGARTVERMFHDGLPKRLGAPLRFLFGGSAPPEAEAAAEQIERRRREISRLSDVYQFEYTESPLGGVRWLERADVRTAEPLVTSRQLALSVSVPRRWGMFLHLCAEGFEARTILELGTSVGISGAYLCSARFRPRLVTLDGSKALASVAEVTLRAVSDNTEIVVGPFENTLQRTLDRLDDERRTVDIAYIDGHHEEAATLQYVRTLVSHLHNEALIILDDIYLFSGMWRAWRTLAASPGMSAALNVGRFGLLVFTGTDSSPRNYDLARYTGWWHTDPSRQRNGTR